MCNYYWMCWRGTSLILVTSTCHLFCVQIPDWSGHRWVGRSLTWLIIHQSNKLDAWSFGVATTSACAPGFVLSLQADERRAPLRTWAFAWGPADRWQPVEAEECRMALVKMEPGHRWVCSLSSKFLFLLFQSHLDLHSEGRFLGAFVALLLSFF